MTKNLGHPHFFTFFQCCGSGSAFILVSWIRIRIRIGNTDPDPGGPKLRIKVKKIQVLKCQMFSFEGWDFCCSLDVLHGGLGISKLQFLIKKKIFSWNTDFSFLSIFLSVWTRILNTEKKYFCIYLKEQEVWGGGAFGKFEWCAGLERPLWGPGSPWAGPPASPSPPPFSRSSPAPYTA
jgi:hypothetical protein